MLNVNQMISDAKKALGWPYVSPGSNGPSGIDCSGLFVYMFRSQGGSIAHGSNTIWRKYTTAYKGRLTDSVKLRPGMAVFKWKSETPPKFDDKLGDFHHIGIVVASDPVRIIHASSVRGKVVQDSSTIGWTHFAALKGVSTETTVQEETMTAKVTASSGSTVNIRASRSLSSEIVGTVSVGSSICVTEKGAEWSSVAFGNVSGYMMTRFLSFGQQDDRLTVL